ncbi:MAG TPA: hypothetical protein VJ654_20830 [Noviherbaspirillum sp.]|nr:hypothetical protein [Noviherbaspirillum sp.]
MELPLILLASAIVVYLVYSLGNHLEANRRKEWKRNWDTWLAKGPSLTLYKQQHPQALRGHMATCCNCGCHKISMIKKGSAYSSVEKRAYGMALRLGPLDEYRAHVCAQCGQELWRSMGQGDPHAKA